MKRKIDTIEMAKQIMKRSHDIIHDYGHAERLEKLGLKIYEDLKAKNIQEFMILHPKLSNWPHGGMTATKQLCLNVPL